MPASQFKGEKSFRGIPVSAGVCRGKILLVGRARPAIAKVHLTEAEVVQEVERLEKALVQTRHQILEIQRKVSEGMGAQEGSIFDAHLLVLEDRTLLDEIVRVIREEKVNAEHAFQTVAEHYAATLAAIEDEYLRERATDMRDVTTRVLNNLLGLEEDALCPPSPRGTGALGAGGCHRGAAQRSPRHRSVANHREPGTAGFRIG